MNRNVAHLPPRTERTFRISEAAIRRKHFNTGLGIVLGIALCVVVLQGHAVDRDTYNDTLLISVVVFIALFSLFNLAGHIRFVLNARKHHLEVSEDRIIFVTGSNLSVLMLNEVTFSEQQSRLREGPSLMMQLKNKRIVRLVGYERQEALTKLVGQRILLSSQ